LGCCYNYGCGRSCVDPHWNRPISFQWPRAQAHSSAANLRSPANHKHPLDALDQRRLSQVWCRAKISCSVRTDVRQAPVTNGGLAPYARVLEGLRSLGCSQNQNHLWSHALTKEMDNQGRKL
jgi:hypothetical protein